MNEVHWADSVSQQWNGVSILLLRALKVIQWNEQKKLNYIKLLWQVSGLKVQCNKLIFISKWKIMCRVGLITNFFFCISIELISKRTQWFRGSVDLPHLQCTHCVINAIYEQYYTNASRCTLVGFLLLVVYCIRKSGVDSHLVVFCHNTRYLSSLNLLAHFSPKGAQWVEEGECGVRHLKHLPCNFSPAKVCSLWGVSALQAEFICC